MTITSSFLIFPYLDGRPAQETRPRRTSTNIATVPTVPSDKAVCNHAGSLESRCAQLSWPLDAASRTYALSKAWGCPPRSRPCHSRLPDIDVAQFWTEAQGMYTPRCGTRCSLQLNSQRFNQGTIVWTRRARYEGAVSWDSVFLSCFLLFIFRNTIGIFCRCRCSSWGRNLFCGDLSGKASCRDQGTRDARSVLLDLRSFFVSSAQPYVSTGRIIGGIGISLALSLGALVFAPHGLSVTNEQLLFLEVRLGFKTRAAMSVDHMQPVD